MAAKPGSEPVSAPGFDRTVETLSTRSAVAARRGMVCASQPLAAAAGVAVMRRGGNAFDAAVATAAVLNVVEPMSTGIGGDVFVLAWPACEQRLIGLNGSGRSASRATVEQLRARGLEKLPDYGADSVTIPGAADAWEALLAKYGKLALEDVLADAIHYAEDGFPLSETIASDWQQVGPRHQDVPEFARNYLVPERDGWRAPRPGEVFRQADLARTLRLLADRGASELYRGELGAGIADYLLSKGSLITAADLAAHRSEWVEPIGAEYRGYTLWELPPNGQGIAALEMLNILEGYELQTLGHNSAAYIHLVAEAKKLAFADRDTWVADPTAHELPIESLLSKEYAARQRALINPQRRGSYPGSGLDWGTDTVYLCTADGEGNVVSFIGSLFHGFGSGLVVPGTGICLQNRGALFSLDPEHLNRIEPSKRPLHTIIPAMVTKDGTPWLCFGVMGGDMQPQGHVQVFLNMVEFGMNPQEAGEAARFREFDGIVAFESGVPAAVREELRAKGHGIARCPGGFGGYQAVRVDSDTGVLIGASDNRKDGCAIGF